MRHRQVAKHTFLEWRTGQEGMPSSQGEGPREEAESQHRPFTAARALGATQLG